MREINCSWSRRDQYIRSTNQCFRETDVGNESAGSTLALARACGQRRAHIPPKDTAMNSLSFLFVALLAVAASAFQAATPSRQSSALAAKSFLDGVKQDPKSNAYARGGMNSWEFEMATMYVEEVRCVSI